MKELLFRSVDLLKYTEEVVDKQPTEIEIKEIIKRYVDSTHPTHIAIAIPLDSNTDFIAHGHTPSPLTIDEYTRVWINAIHEAGVNVYFRGTFAGIKNLYDFGFDKATPIGTAESAITDGRSTWMGRIYQWFTQHLSEFRRGDAIGIIPDTTNNAFNGNFFLSNTPNPQTNFLDFYTELKKVSDSLFKEAIVTNQTNNTTSVEPVYTGLSSNAYKDIANTWIPSLLFDLTGIMVVGYYGEEKTPAELERVLNELFDEFHLPIFLSQWSDDVNRNDPVVQTILQQGDFYDALSRLREKGVLIGLNYFDGYTMQEGIFTTTGQLNDKGFLLGTFFSQGVVKKEKKIEPIMAKSEQKIDITEKVFNKATVEMSDAFTTEVVQPTLSTTQPSQTISSKKEATKEIEVSKATRHYSIKLQDVDTLMLLFIYGIIGINATYLTSLVFRTKVDIWIALEWLCYTMVAGVIHLIFDGK